MLNYLLSFGTILYWHDTEVGECLSVGGRNQTCCITCIRNTPHSALVIVTPLTG